MQIRARDFTQDRSLPVLATRATTFNRIVTIARQGRATGIIRGGDGSAAVIFLSRIIKPDDSIPRDIVCRVNITETHSYTRGGARGRRVTRVYAHSHTHACMWSGREASDTSCELLGFHLAARPDWTNRHCHRVTRWHPSACHSFLSRPPSPSPSSLSSSPLPLFLPRTRHAHSRGLMGIIRRYYLRGGEGFARRPRWRNLVVARVLIHGYDSPAGRRAMRGPVCLPAVSSPSDRTSPQRLPGESLERPRWYRAPGGRAT